MPHISSCRLFKALGLVSQSHCDELPPVPEPIDAGDRSRAAEETYNKLALDVSTVHEEHNKLLGTTRSITTRDQAADRLSAAKKIINAHKEAYKGETALAVAKSILLNNEKTKLLTSPNGKYFAFVGCANTTTPFISIDSIMPDKVCGEIIAAGGEYAAFENNAMYFQGYLNSKGLQLTDKGKIIAL